jgi:hypothetical protein
MVFANQAAVRLLEALDVDALLATRPGELAARFRITREDGSPVTVDDLPGQRLVTGRPGAPLLTRSVHRASGRERWLLTKASLLDDEGGGTGGQCDRGRDREQARGSRQRFLACASRLPVGRAADDMPQRLAEMAVQDLSDWCTLDTLDEAGQVTRVAVAHRDPAKLALAHEIDRRCRRRPDRPARSPSCTPAARRSSSRRSPMRCWPAGPATTSTCGC